jgi:hypothetical protein
MNGEFVLTEKTYVAGAWFMSIALAGHDKKVGDMLLQIMRKDGDADWEVVTRMRKYNDDKAFGSTDEKDFLAQKYPAVWNADKVIELGKAYMQLASKIYTSNSVFDVEVDEVIVKGGAEEFILALSSRPWAHIQILKDESGGTN